MVRLQENLGKVALFWAESESSIQPCTQQSWPLDQAKYRRSVLVLGTICFFLSWLGFAAQMIVMLSVRYLAVSRIEQKVFSSTLVTKDLAVDEVSKLVSELKKLYPKLVTTKKT